MKSFHPFRNGDTKQNGHSSSNGGYMRSLSNNSETEFDDVNRQSQQHGIHNPKQNGSVQRRSPYLQSAKRPPMEQSENGLSGGSHQYSSSSRYGNSDVSLSPSRQSKHAHNGHSSHGFSRDKNSTVYTTTPVEHMGVSDNNTAQSENNTNTETSPRGMESLHTLVLNDQSREYYSYRNQNAQSQPRSKNPTLGPLELETRVLNTLGIGNTANTHEGVTHSNDVERNSRYTHVATEQNHDISPLELRVEDPLQSYMNRHTTTNQNPSQPTSKRPQWHQPTSIPQPTVYNHSINNQQPESSMFSSRLQTGVQPPSVNTQYREPESFSSTTSRLQTGVLQPSITDQQRQPESSQFHTWRESTETQPTTGTQQPKQRPFMVNSQSTAKDLVNLTEFVEPHGGGGSGGFGGGEFGGGNQMYGHNPNPWATRMHTKENRLRSFVRWPKEDIVSAESLAEFGWYFTGPDDRVECPFCCGAVYNWVKGDTALGEHKRHFPNCPFIKDKLKSMLEPVQPQQQNMETSLRPQQIPGSLRPLQQNTGSLRPLQQNMETSLRPPVVQSQGEMGSETASVSTAIEIVKELGYGDEQIDRALDDLSRQDKVITSQNILEAIFASPSQPETPSTPLNRETPQSQTISHPIPQTIPTTVSSQTHTTTNDPTPKSTIGEKSSAVSTEDVLLDLEKEETAQELAKRKEAEKKELSTLSAEYEELQAKITCKICLDAKIESLFLPCRHLVCCDNCANMVRECPFCRARIEGVVKVYL